MQGNRGFLGVVVSEFRARESERDERVARVAVFWVSCLRERVVSRGKTSGSSLCVRFREPGVEMVQIWVFKRILWRFSLGLGGERWREIRRCKWVVSG